MRVTNETKAGIRQRILESARKLFVVNGFEETLTRDITVDAGIATGTLFNHFPTKEAVAQELISDALEQAREEFRRAPSELPLEESLFLYVVLGLRRLKPLRRMIPAVLETAFSPLREGDGVSRSEDIRVRHLQGVRELIVGKAPNAGEPSVITLHLYWSLYLGVLAFWSGDESPNQEDTLALLDQATRLFATVLEPSNKPKETSDDSERS